MADWWMRVRPDLPNARRVILICRELGLSPTKSNRREIAWDLIEVWAWAAKTINAREIVPRVTLDDVDVVVDRPGLGEAMASVGWAEIRKSGVRFPNFFEWNDPHHSGPKSDAQRAREYRARQKAGNISTLFDDPKSSRTRHFSDPPDGPESAISSRSQGASSRSVTTEQDKEVDGEEEYPTSTTNVGLGAALLGAGVRRAAAAAAAHRFPQIPEMEVRLELFRARQDETIRNPAGFILKRLESWDCAEPSREELCSMLRQWDDRVKHNQHVGVVLVISDQEKYPITDRWRELEIIDGHVNWQAAFG